MRASTFAYTLSPLMTGVIKPFRIAVDDDVLLDLRERLRRTRWPG